MIFSKTSLSGFTMIVRVRLRRARDRIAGWLAFRFIMALARKMGEDDVSYLAASISYYAVLSLFPIIFPAR